LKLIEIDEFVAALPGHAKAGPVGLSNRILPGDGGSTAPLPTMHARGEPKIEQGRGSCRVQFRSLATYMYWKLETSLPNWRAPFTQ
jgi:hypothetical protein